MADRVKGAQDARGGATTVEGRAEVIQARHGRAIATALQMELRAVLTSPAGIARKVVRIREVADKVAGLIERHTICRKGCANCCSIANIISARDAARLAEYTGRKVAAVPNTPPLRDMQSEVVAKFNGVPCPFLGANKACTVYPVRPLTCRTHHSLEATPDPCYSDDNVRRSVAQIDLTLLYMAEVELLAGEPFADIREFFPPIKA